MGLKGCFSRSIGWGALVAGELFLTNYAGEAAGNTPPVIVQPAQYLFHPLTNGYLNVSADDDGGESNLTYTWETVGTPPAPVEFDPNGTNEAKVTTATFHKAGAYSFKVTVRDAGGLTATSSVDGSVESIVTGSSSFWVTPDTAIVPFSAAAQFTAHVSDQFGDLVPNLPYVKRWTVGSSNPNAGVTIDFSGLFTAGTVACTATVTAVADIGSKERETSAIAIVVPGPSAISNLAFNKPATASSYYCGYEPAKAVDGDTTTRWASRCETTPWLEVDFGRLTTFDSVVINEGTWNRIRSYEIQYWNGSCWITAFTGGDPANIQQDRFPAVTGTKVRLTITSSTTEPTIREFGVYKMARGNLVLNKPATASSNYGGYEADKAVDANTSTRWASRSETMPWLEIDLGSNSTFDSVVINEGTWDRIRSYEIRYWNGLAWVTAFTGSNPANIQRDKFGAVTGSKVRLQITSSTYEPTIWEFEVYKTLIPNLALNKPAASSSNYGGYEAAKAVDDNFATRWASRSETTPWLEINFGSPTMFDSTIIDEGMWDRIRSYEIQYWNGSSWVTAFSGGNPANIQRDKIPTVTSSKVRLRVTSSTFDPTIWEFGVYNSASVQTPYNEHNIINGATLPAVYFDNGGEGVAYHDNDAANQGGQFRMTEGVDIEHCSAGGYNVGWTNGGEWMEYTCNVMAGTYNITLYMATPYTDAHPVRLYQDGALKATFTVANTGGWQIWSAVTVNNVSLSAGVGSVLKLEIANTGVNIDKIVFGNP